MNKLKLFDLKLYLPGFSSKLATPLAEPEVGGSFSSQPSCLSLARLLSGLTFWDDDFLPAFLPLVPGSKWLIMSQITSMEPFFTSAATDIFS